MANWLTSMMGGGNNPYGPNQYTGQMQHATDTSNQNAQQSWGQTQDLLSGGSNALDKWAAGAMSSAMPGLTASLQSSKEDAQRRGISTGDLGTSYQGDITGAFQKNFSNALAGQAMNLYGTQLGANEQMYGQNQNNYLNMLSGLNNQQIGANKWQNQQGQNIGGTIGGLVGFGVGGPVGANVGGAAGGLFGGMF